MAKNDKAMFSARIAGTTMYIEKVSHITKITKKEEAILNKYGFNVHSCNHNIAFTNNNNENITKLYQLGCYLNIRVSPEIDNLYHQGGN